MCSRVLGRVIAKQVGRWAEHLKLLDKNQAGFRKGRSTADVVQVMQRIQEDVVDCKRRVNDGANGMCGRLWLFYHSLHILIACKLRGNRIISTS